MCRATAPSLRWCSPTARWSTTARPSARTAGAPGLLGLFRRGIFLNPMSTKLYLSLAHTEREIEAFLEVARATLRAECRG